LDDDIGACGYGLGTDAPVGVMVALFGLSEKDSGAGTSLRQQHHQISACPPLPGDGGQRAGCSDRKALTTDEACCNALLDNALKHAQRMSFSRNRSLRARENAE